MTHRKRRDAGDSASSAPDFDPVPLRHRRDGLTPERQVAFIRALAECGCVRDACRHVGVSPEAVYRLARRPDAQSFRVAWDIAMDNAVRRIGDEAFSRCIHGVSVPHFYKGELIGEHRRYDERLTMFILRYRDPLRYGRHLDRADRTGHVEEKALGLADALAWVQSDARREAAGISREVIRDLPVANDDDEEGRPRFGNPFGGACGDDDPYADDPYADDPNPGSPDPEEPGEGSSAPHVSSTSSTSSLRQGSGGGPGLAPATAPPAAQPVAGGGSDEGDSDPGLRSTGEAP